MHGAAINERSCRAVLLAALVLMTGCGKQAQVRVPAKAGDEEPQETFAFSEVRVRYDAPDITVAYKVSNLGTKRARAGACLDVLDKDGFVIEQLSPGDFSLRPGDQDELEEKVTLEPKLWAQARGLRLYAGQHFSCMSAPDTARSALLHLDLSGTPLAPGTPIPKVQPEPSLLEKGPPSFSVEDLTLTQDEASGRVTLAYQVTNIRQQRAAGSLCVRLYADGACDCRSLEHTRAGEFNLAPGVSERSSAELEFEDDSVWGKTRLLKIYTARFGCFGDVEDATSAVVTLNKPEAILPPPEFIPQEPPAQGASSAK